MGVVAFGYRGGIRLGGEVELFDLEGALEFEKEDAVGGVQEGGEGVGSVGGYGGRWMEGDGWHWGIYWKLVFVRKVY